MKTIRLTIGYATGSTEERVLVDGTYLVGNTAGDIVLQDPAVSSRHAVIHVFDGQVTFTDQGSLNGTFDMQGQQLREACVMRPGQSLRLGSSSITLTSVSEAAPRTGVAVHGVMATGTVAMPAYSSPVRTRATVIKLPDATPGLLVVGAAQKPFVLEGVWRAAVAPAIGMNVDVELDAPGNVVAIFAVDAQQAMFEQGQQIATLARGGLGMVAQRMGKVELGAAVVLWIAWFFLPSASFLGVASASFWDLLGTCPGIFGLSVGHGVGSFLGLLAIAAPFGVLFLKGSRTRLLNAAPVGFLLLVSLRVAVGMLGSSDPGVAKDFGRIAQSFAQKAEASMWKMLAGNLSWGFWIVVITSGVLFWCAGGLSGVLKSLPTKGNLATAQPQAGLASLGAYVDRIGKVELGAARSRRGMKIFGVCAGVLLLGGLGFFAFKHFSRSPLQGVLEMMQGMVAIVKDERADCEVKGERLQQLLNDHRKDLEELPKIPVEELKAQNAKLESEGREMERSMSVVSMAQCMMNPSYREAFLAINTAFQSLEQRMSYRQSSKP